MYSWFAIPMDLAQFPYHISKVSYLSLSYSHWGIGIILLYLPGLNKSSIEWFLALFDSQWMFFGSKLIPKHVS